MNAHVGDQTVPPILPVTKTKLGAAAWFRIVSLALLVFSLFVPAGVAFAWAITSLMHLPSGVILGAEVLGAVPMVFACLIMTRAAWRFEVDPRSAG